MQKVYFVPASVPVQGLTHEEEELAVQWLSQTENYLLSSPNDEVLKERTRAKLMELMAMNTDLDLTNDVSDIYVRKRYAFFPYAFACSECQFQKILSSEEHFVWISKSNIKCDCGGVMSDSNHAGFYDFDILMPS